MNLEMLAMKIKSKDFRVKAGDKVDLARLPTEVKQAYGSKKAYHKLLDAQVEELSELQRLHTTPPTVMPCCRCFRPWTRPARTAPSGT